MKTRFTFGLTLLLFLSTTTYLQEDRKLLPDAVPSLLEVEMAHRDSLTVESLLCQQEAVVAKKKS